MPFIQYLYKLLISIFIVVSFDKGVVQLFLILLLNLLNIIYFAVIKPYYHKHHKFNNNTIRTTIGCEAFLFHIIDYQPISKYLQPYGGISIGFLKSNVNQSTLENTAIKTKYNDWAFLYTYQLGTKINLTHRIKIQLQTNLNFTSSDWLDNYKPNVPANKKKDAFNEFTIGFTYLFGEKTKPSLLWDAPKDLVLIKTKKNNLKEEIQETKIKVTEPLYYDLKKVESADYNENEFDCIIKF